MKKTIVPVNSRRITRLALVTCLCLLGAHGNLATAQTLTTLYSFSGSDGADPHPGLVQGSDGNFYSTTVSGGASTNCPGGCGTVFRIGPSGSLTNLYSFNGSDGATPYCLLAQGSDGNFYGTTFFGGASGDGTVFQISPQGNFTSLYSFSGNDGAFPYSGLVQGNDGNFYGTTVIGGASTNCPGGCGTVFRISPGGNLTNLHSFSGSDGDWVIGALVQGSDGNFYGQTYYGGASNSGTVYRISPTGAVTNLHSFSGTDGYEPTARLVQGTDGNFYSTTGYGGTTTDGTVYLISPSGNFTNLHFFSGSDGANPFGRVVQGSDGNFYGATGYGGANNSGTVYRITPSGSLTNLHSFSGSDGAKPIQFVQGSDGNFYGTTECGGTYGSGTVFKLSVPFNPPANQIAGIEFFSVFDDTYTALLIPSVAGETYQLQYSDSMSPAYWFDTGGSITSSGGPLTLYDLDGVLPPQRFYRAVIIP